MSIPNAVDSQDVARTRYYTVVQPAVAVDIAQAHVVLPKAHLGCFILRISSLADKTRTWMAEIGTHRSKVLESRRRASLVQRHKPRVPMLARFDLFSFCLEKWLGGRGGGPLHFPVASDADEVV